jgi:hypothetical protein
MHVHKYRNPIRGVRVDRLPGCLRRLQPPRCHVGYAYVCCCSGGHPLAVADVCGGVPGDWFIVFLAPSCCLEFLVPLTMFGWSMSLVVSPIVFACGVQVACLLFWCSAFPGLHRTCRLRNEVRGIT